MVNNKTKGITSQKSFGGSGSQMSLFGRTEETTENTLAFPGQTKKERYRRKKKLKNLPDPPPPPQHTNNSEQISTFISSMFLGPPGPDCKPHMYRIRQVFPQPVSPITTTGIPHLQLNQCKDKQNRLRLWPNLRLHQQHPSRTKHFY